MDRAATVVGCTVSEGSPPMLSVKDRSIVRDVIVEEANMEPTDAAAVAGADCVISGCTFVRSRGDGLRVGAGSRVSGCIVETCAANGLVSTGAGVSFVDCTARNCAQVGIRLSDRGIAQGCNVADNQTGILAEGRARISGCEASNNGWGITCAGLAHITGNTVAAPIPGVGPVGILVNGWGNHIEGNSIYASGGPIGIRVTGVGNVITRNTVRRTGLEVLVAYDIVAGNDVAEIGAAGTVTSPLANVQY